MMVKVCSNCNNSNNDDARYCSNCGFSFNDSQVIKQAIPLPITKVVPSGMCFYHPNLRATYICRLCGRSICRHDSRLYGEMIICSLCDLGLHSMPVWIMSYTLPILVNVLPRTRFYY